MAYAGKPDVGSLFEHETDAENLSEGVELAFSARELATRISSRSRDSTYRVTSPIEGLPDDGTVLTARGGFARRRPRRRAWVDLESEGSPSGANGFDGTGGSSSEHQGRDNR